LRYTSRFKISRRLVYRALGVVHRGPRPRGFAFAFLKRFAAVIQQCDLLLSMTGTAAEQCVGLGKPVLQLVGDGPQFTDNFAEAQRRLLGPGLFCAPGNGGSEEQLRGTAELLEGLLNRLLVDQRWHEELRQLGDERIGSGGGAAKMSADLLERLAQRHG